MQENKIKDSIPAYCLPVVIFSAFLPLLLIIKLKKMTIEEFDKTGWTGNMKCIFQCEEYGIATVDFEERLVGIYEMISGAESEDDISWKRCENIELLQQE